MRDGEGVKMRWVKGYGEELVGRAVVLVWDGQGYAPTVLQYWDGVGWQDVPVARE